MIMIIMITDDDKIIFYLYTFMVLKTINVDLSDIEVSLFSCFFLYEGF